MFETRLSLIGFAPNSHKLTTRNYLLDHDVPDHVLPEVMETARTRQSRHLPTGMREETGRRKRTENSLDLVTSKRIPTRIVYALELDNWSFAEEIPAFALRNYDDYQQFWDLRPVSRKDGKIKAISLQYLNAVGSPYDVTLNIAVEQPGIGRMLRTLIKLHPRIINAS
ncbi:hypothetical protein JCM17844_30030 [Iodidimonas gelatinilytica]|uniref:Uncharacterized protein n=1 Tax=Iodidimonas gelatinilytica TaxID=1236966 RepID=A0A5A7MU94_9PROT|nr:hypothetical protein [Iodidimonas gelatinilytica]GEQ99366.1 hypothetical protein JCM17844_30030 [Iodidimonas gelatinilytica]